MSPAAAYVPQASTARSMTVSLSSGSMMVTGMSGALAGKRFDHRLLVFADDDGRFDGVCLVLDQVLESTAFGQTSGDPDHRLGREAGQRGACRMTRWWLWNRPQNEQSRRRRAASATVSMRWPPGLNEVSAFSAVSRSAPSPSTNANAVNASATRCGYSEPSGSARCVKSVTGGQSDRLSHCAAGHAAPVHDPAIFNADLAGLRARRA